MNSEVGMRNAENKKRRRACASDLILFVLVLVNQNFMGDEGRSLYSVTECGTS